MKDENNSGKIIRLSNGGIGGIYCIGCKCKPPAAAVDINHSTIKANNENQSNEKKKYSISIFIGIIDLLHEFNNVYRRFRMVNNIYVKRIFVEVFMLIVYLNFLDNLFLTSSKNFSK